ncbi:MAG: porin [Rhodobacteraceae bacterium]|uniref:porin n=1 Tax=Amaricoccus sp. B4 TaxID=3368557 RepID=UPI000DAE5721|nr:porin [Paracoccaceae bacterium]
MTSHRRLRGALALVLSTTAMPIAALALEDQGIQPFEWEFQDNTKIVFYGQIDVGSLWFNDGDETTSYGLVGNKNSSSRIGVTSTTNFDSGWELFSNIEAEYVPHPSSSVNQLDKYQANYDFDKTNFRKAEIAMSSEKAGKVWLGQGSMATDGITEIDLSGTTVVAYSNVADSGGGLFRFDNDTLSGVSTKDAYSNYDGNREMRVRYDTPSFSGFRLKAAYGQDVLHDDNDSIYDVAATYEGDYAAFDVSAGIGYARYDGSDSDIFSGSMSGLHKASGVSLTLAAGQKSAEEDAHYGYVKLGWQHDFFRTGATAFAVDYYKGDGVTVDGSDSTTYAFAAVQNFDFWNTQYYLTVRQYEYDDDAGSYQNGLTTFTGLRVKF